MTGTPTWRRGAGDTSGTFEGADHGSQISLFVVDAAPGTGPRLHRHPYSETFVVSTQTPHGFKSLGPERLKLVAIHAAPRMETTWLE